MNTPISTEDRSDQHELGDCESPPSDYSTVAFFGRTLRDYTAFFGISPGQLKGCRVLDCAAGAASFTAEAALAGIDAVACDPLYNRCRDALEKLGRMDLEHVMRVTRANAHRFDFSGMGGGIEALRTRRERALEQFLADYSGGMAVGRYQCVALPSLPFRDGEFDLVLCGHFLMLYSDRLDYRFHLEAVRELVRVSRGEARVYPLLDTRGIRFIHLERLRKELKAYGIRSRIKKVDYQFLKGSNEVLVLERKE